MNKNTRSFMPGEISSPETRVGKVPRGVRPLVLIIGLGLATAVPLTAMSACAQSNLRDWEQQVRTLAAQQNWPAATKLVDERIARAPNDIDLLAWRARLLEWSGHLSQSEREYQTILKTSRTDPDIWMGLSNVYWREGKVHLAVQAISSAEALAPKRTDIHTACGKILEAAGDRNAARQEFREALALSPGDDQARAALAALRGEPRNDLRVGQENDVLSYADSIHNEYAELASHWTPRWTTDISGRIYQYYGVHAEKLLASVTHREPIVGAFTLGGAVANDHEVIPKREAFWGLDQGWKVSDTSFVRGLELAFEQHWYWYRSARVLTLNSTMLFYLPSDWILTVGATGARSAFTATRAEWKPSELGRLEFPLAGLGSKRLVGHLLFAAGTEDFAKVDQIGSFSSQTFGTGLRFRVSARQDFSEYVNYEKRSQGRTDIGFGLSYGIHF